MTPIYIEKLEMDRIELSSNRRTRVIRCQIGSLTLRPNT